MPLIFSFSMALLNKNEIRFKTAVLTFIAKAVPASRVATEGRCTVHSITFMLSAPFSGLISALISTLSTPGSLGLNSTKGNVRPLPLIRA